MGYFAGPNLDRKVEEYELGELVSILSSIVSGTGTWPGELAIPVEERYLEQLRIVLYSILHRFGLKDEFTVRMVSSRSLISINTKGGGGVKKRTGSIQRIDTVPLAGAAPVDVLVEEEDMSGIFSADDPLLLDGRE